MTYKIPFEYIELHNSGVHICLTATINNVENLLLLIDTGASNSVFDVENIAFENIESFSPDEENLASGFNSEIESMSVGRIDEIILDNFSTSIEPAVFTSLAHVNSVYAKINLEPLAGIIGCDFLKKHSAIIDFEKKLIYLKDIIYK